MHGGVGSSLGAAAKEFRHNGLKANPAPAGARFDFIDGNVARSRAGPEDGFDLLPVNAREAFVAQARRKARGSGLGRPLDGKAFAFGHAALECEGPAALWNLIVLDGPDGPAGMMAPGPAQPAREMRFRAPPAPARLGLAIANGGGARTSCHVALAAADGRAAPPAGFPLISVPARATAIRFLDGMFAVPADFAGGAATLRCDHAVGAVAVPVAGAAFTAVPPIIPGLETVPEATVDSGGDTPGGSQ